MLSGLVLFANTTTLYLLFVLNGSNYLYRVLNSSIFYHIVHGCFLVGLAHKIVREFVGILTFQIIAFHLCFI